MKVNENDEVAFLCDKKFACESYTGHTLMGYEIYIQKAFDYISLQKPIGPTLQSDVASSHMATYHIYMNAYN
jgi:hypothetical protein